MHDAGYLDFLEHGYARWQALPNDRQLAALLSFEDEWNSQRSVPPAPPS